MASTKKQMAYEAAQEKNLLSAINCAAIVRVMAFNPEMMTVDVSPLVRRPMGDSFQTPPPILSVPVAAVRGGGYIVRPWYKVGDVGVIVYLDVDSDNAISSGDACNPNTERLHSGDDAVFIGGIFAGEGTAPGLPAESLVLSTEDGQTYIAISTRGILIKGDLQVDGGIKASGDITPDTSVNVE